MCERMLPACSASGLRLDSAAVEVRRGGMAPSCGGGSAPAARERFDHVVIATHADQALRLLPDATPDEKRLLGAFRYSRNRAVLHTDPALMPRRRAVWSSWNYAAGPPTPGRVDASPTG